MKTTAIFESHRLKTLNSGRTCFEEGCTKPAIDSHILQKNGIISKIAEKGHVIECAIDLFESDYQMRFKRTGVNKVFTFKGFCTSHDNSLFKEIEQSSYDLSNYRHQLLFAYRTSVNETRKKENVIDCYNSIIDDPTIKLPAEPLLNAIYGQKIGIIDGNFTRKSLLKNIRSHNLQEFTIHTFEVPIRDVCLCGVTTYETSFEIKKMEIENNPKFFTPLTDVFVTLLPQDTNSVLSVCFLKGHNMECDKYYSSLFEQNDKDIIIQYISDLMLLQMENWIVSESFYHSNIKPNETTIKTIINWAYENWDERISLDFNIFKNK